MLRLGVYEPQREPSGCLEVWVLTRAAFGVLLWPLLALAAVLAVVVAGLFLFAIHPALVLVPVGALVAGLLLFARWEQRRYRPPDG